MSASSIAACIAAARDRVDLLHSPANTGPLRPPRGVAHVVTVHDAMFMLRGLERSPSLYQRLGRRYRRAVVGASRTSPSCDSARRVPR